MQSKERQTLLYVSDFIGSPFFFFLNLNYIYWGGGACKRHGTHVELTGQLAEISSVLLLHWVPFTR